MVSANLDKFFATINAELNAHLRFNSLAASQFAPDFNIFSCFYPNENRLSSIISMLLDPNGEHGQGEVFLSLFLDVIEKTVRNQDIVSKLHQGLMTGRTSKTLEATTHAIENSLRRIDILLDVGGTRLAIENKPWTGDREKQIEDYNEHLKTLYLDRYLLIYLSGDGCAPSEESLAPEKREELETSGHYLIISYIKLRDWVGLCAEKCRSSRVRNFLEDFHSYITLQFDGGMTIMEEQLVIEQATKRENIRAAFAIQSSWPDIANKLIETLAKLVKQRVETEHGPWKLEVEYKYFSGYSGFYFRRDEWSKYRIGFVFEKTSANAFFCGILKTSEQQVDESDTRLAEKLDKIHKLNGYPDTWWAWWKYFDAPYRDWSSSAEAWAGIYENGNTINAVASMLEQMIGCVANDIDEFERKLKAKHQTRPISGTLSSG